MISEGEIVYWNFYILQYLDLPKAAKWFQYRLSIHHPLGFNWNLLEGAHFLSENQSWQLSLQMNEGSIISKKANTYPFRKWTCPLKRDHFKRKGRCASKQWYGKKHIAKRCQKRLNYSLLRENNQQASCFLIVVLCDFVWVFVENRRGVNICIYIYLYIH